MTKSRQETSFTSSTRVAVYARFSCDKQRDESIEDQVAEAERYCKERGYDIVKVYPDYAISGRSDDRPQFLQMIEDAKTGAFDVVLVWKIDRFARNMQDQGYYEKVLSEAGVRLESMKERISGGGIEASMSKGMLAIFAQIRSQQSAEDTMRGMLGKARKCQYLGYQQFGYSHDGDTITLDPLNAPIAEEIHMRFLAGEAIVDIAEWLNSLGVRTYAHNKVGNSFVTGILKNWRYAGIYLWGFEKDEHGNKILDGDGNPIPLVCVDGGMPAIVSKDVKERCIRLLGFHKHAHAKVNYLLSGKMYCSKCGHPMRGETCKNGAGVNYWRYTCQKKRKACLGVFWKDKTEAAIVGAVRSMLKDTMTLERIAEVFAEYRSGKKPKEAILAAKNDLRDLKRQRDNLLKAVEDGMPYKHVKTKMQVLDLHQEGIERKIAELEREEDEISKEDVLEVLMAIADGARTDAEIISAFVSQVWLYEGYAVAIMNFTGKNTNTEHEVNCLMKTYEPVKDTCSLSIAHGVPDFFYTNTAEKTPLLYTCDGVPVALLENGFGVIVNLHRAA